jgi:hypothetical protein
MKLINYFSLAIAILVQLSSAYSADADFIGLIKEVRQASAIANYLEPSPVPSGIADGQRRMLKPISAFGGLFEGEVAFKGGTQTELLLWTQEPSLSPQAAWDYFNKMASSLESELGQGRIVANIPNYGDASYVKATAALWFIGKDIVLLQLNRYPSRGGIEVVRRNKDAWRSSMGADESDFWVQTLDSKTGNESRPETQAEQVPGKGVNAPITTYSEASSAPEAKPAPPPSEEPTLSLPWSIIGILIVVATGLLWLLLKGRK